MRTSPWCGVEPPPPGVFASVRRRRAPAGAQLVVAGAALCAGLLAGPGAAPARRRRWRGLSRALFLNEHPLFPFCSVGGVVLVVVRRRPAVVRRPGEVLRRWWCGVVLVRPGAQRWPGGGPSPLRGLRGGGAVAPGRAMPPLRTPDRPRPPALSRLFSQVKVPAPAVSAGDGLGSRVAVCRAGVPALAGRDR